MGWEEISMAGNKKSIMDTVNVIDRFFPDGAANCL
jgi:hypothetical protein